MTLGCIETPPGCGKATRFGAALATAGALLLAGCATTAMDAQWRDPQAVPLSMQGKKVLVVCRGLDLTLERICEDRLAADAQAIGVTVVRAELPAAATADPAAIGDALLQAARAAGADAVLATTLSRQAGAAPSSGGSFGIGIGGASGGWGSRTGAGIGITLPIGGAGGAALGASTNLADTANGRLLWSGRARSPRASSEAEQVPELTRVIAEALRGAALF